MKAYVWFRGQEPILLSIRGRYKQSGFDYGYCTYQGITYEVCQATTFNGRKDWNPVKKEEKHNVQDFEIQTY